LECIYTADEQADN